MDRSELVQGLLEFVARELLHGDGSELDEDTPLLEWGVLDSRSMVSILAFIEDTFGLDVPDEAVRPEHFANIRCLATLLDGLRVEQSEDPRSPAPSSSIRALKPTGLQQGEVDLGDGRVLHQLRAAGMPPPWLLLPEPGNSASIWGAMLRSVQGDQAAAAFDLLGFGHSLSFEREPGFEDQLQLVRDGAVRFSSLPAVVVASGLSGWLAIEYARRCPDRVRALVLVGTGLPKDPAHWLKRLAVLAEKPDAWTDELHYRAPSLTERTRRSIHRALAQPAHGAFLRTVEPVMHRGLAGVDVPTLMVVGDHDVFTSRRDLAALAATGQSTVVERIPRCGHLPHVERSQEMLMIMRQFLAPLGEVVGR